MLDTYVFDSKLGLRNYCCENLRGLTLAQTAFEKTRSRQKSAVSLTSNNNYIYGYECRRALYMYL